ncbi:polysaccharide deacetylase [Paeniglutamicibacter gangotriensis Lz1y]|uniref:Polysaccharide deacetylase n=1 Tax=Paeniglutamicibacter gangotriensis Lz1y TaxID=1276920 RepID=M7NDN5_9MICC|nr:polysaccharide deacetylase [Paeniglutamicibacter gangotriensis Lz1y]
MTRSSVSRSKTDPAYNVEVIGITEEAPRLMRPLSGTVNRVRYGASPPLPRWLSDMDTLDWKLRDSTTVIADVLHEPQPGSFVLMHAIHGASVNAMPTILSGLKARAKGHGTLTAFEILVDETPKSRTVHSHGPVPKLNTLRPRGPRLPPALSARRRTPEAGGDLLGEEPIVAHHYHGAREVQ